MKNINTAVATTTGKRILRNTLGLAAVLCAVAIPGYCGTAFLSYSDSWSTLTGANNITVTCSASPCSSSNETLSSFDVPVNQLGISGTAAYAADIGTWAITGGTEVYSFSGSTVTVTINGTIGACTGCSAGSNLTGVSGALEILTYTLASGIPFNASTPNAGTTFDTSLGTGTPSNNNFALNLGAATTVTDLAALLSDLGDTGATSAINSGGINSTGTGNESGSGAHTYNSTGSMLLGVTLTTPTVTPEPVSLILFGSGLMGVALIARRRKVSQN